MAEAKAREVEEVEEKEETRAEEEARRVLMITAWELKVRGRVAVGAVVGVLSTRRLQ